MIVGKRGRARRQRQHRGQRDPSTPGRSPSASKHSGNWLSVGGGVNVGGSGVLVAAAGPARRFSGSLTYTSSASSTYSGTILGAASVVTLNSPAGTTLTLSGSNQYGGGTVLQSGMLRPTSPAALGTGGLTMSGGTLDLDSLPSLGDSRWSGPPAASSPSRSAGTTALIVSTTGSTYLPERQ